MNPRTPQARIAPDLLEANRRFYEGRVGGLHPTGCRDRVELPHSARWKWQRPPTKFHVASGR